MISRTSRLSLSRMVTTESFRPMNGAYRKLFTELLPPLSTICTQFSANVLTVDNHNESKLMKMWRIHGEIAMCSFSMLRQMYENLNALTYTVIYETSGNSGRRKQLWKSGGVKLMKIAETSPMNINRLSTTVERSSMAHDERASVAGREIWVKKKSCLSNFLTHFAHYSVAV